MTDGNRFYFDGKYFKTYDEFCDYIKKWNNLPLNEETAEKILEVLKRDIKMNIFLRGVQMENREFELLVQYIFIFAIEKINEKVVSKLDDKN